MRLWQLSSSVILQRLIWTAPDLLIGIQNWIRSLRTSRNHWFSSLTEYTFRLCPSWYDLGNLPTLSSRKIDDLLNWVQCVTSFIPMNWSSVLTRRSVATSFSSITVQIHLAYSCYSLSSQGISRTTLDTLYLYKLDFQSPIWAEFLNNDHLYKCANDLDPHGHPRCIQNHSAYGVFIQTDC